MIVPLGGSSGSPAGLPKISAKVVSSICFPSLGSMSWRYPIGNDGCCLMSVRDVLAKTMSTVESSRTVVATSQMLYLSVSLETTSVVPGGHLRPEVALGWTVRRLTVLGGYAYLCLCKQGADVVGQ